ncbi:PTS transporter subunit EIIC [Enterococcus sp. 669A]|uniref:PTS transporter subunit EIIC n=1 Tax=Candidatus Enterococcus moelleringii TaxID=2815325 RepID=A0ABS3LFE0_9ENTE|nr:alpha-glucoside-specific PTS transporter subunit IIBC [Enterococcus sp. 669A]MBO1308357.1 PTS transporter subunit EIIC [Enterococcus sp. 669A]
MTQKLQRFGGAMFGPVMFMIFSSILIGLSSIFMNASIMGSLAAETNGWFKVWSLVSDAGYAVFNQLPIMFVASIPLKLADKAKGNASVEALLTYFVFNYYIQGILNFWGSTFNIDFSQEVGGTSGLTMIAGIKTLDMNIVGAILVASIVVWIHNKFYEKKLPDILNVFQGASLVAIIGTIVMLPLALAVCWIWPIIQQGILGMQGFLSQSGIFGIFLFTFLERITIPTGLHHFLWVPFDLGPAVVPDGNWNHWLANLNEFAQSSQPLKSLFPSGGFALYGNVGVWGIPGISLAMYKLARPENKKKVLSLLLPITITSMLTGITEPVEFSFLFLAPVMFVIHAALAALMSTILYFFGVVGYQGGGLIDYVTVNWLPMFSNHANTVITHIVIGLIFFVVYYYVFYYGFKKLNVMTPGRELDLIEGETSVLEETIDVSSEPKENNAFSAQARQILAALGGRENIAEVTNCMTRLRVTVNDETKLLTDSVFKQAKAHGVVRKGKGIQVIIGMNVENVRSEFDKLLKN